MRINSYVVAAILYLSSLVFLVRFTVPNVQLPNVKSVFKSFDHAMYTKYIN